ncbi:MAG TPA: aminoglycoside phosphotransferase family protein [Mycobacteriales bacterium]|nr:aminoglycoside phosphotransferase family protein [Mycobacteriales bacterium]
MDPVAVARCFGLGGGARSQGVAARGKQGVVWRLDTTDGSWAVKVPFRPSTEAEVRAATEFQEAAYAAGVPTPRVQRTTDGCVLATVDGIQVRVHEWVDVGAPDPLVDPAVVGSVVARMHQVPGTVIGAASGWHQGAVGADRWDELVAQLREAGAPFAHRLAELRDELVALEEWIEPPDAIRACHRDLWADNLLPTPAGGVCVIDWEDSGPADPSHELGCVLFEFARTDARRARALIEAYRAAGGPGQVSRRGHFSMLIAQLGHITETAAIDWLRPNARSPDRADSEAWIVEVFDDPHTRDRLDALLAALASQRR